MEQININSHIYEQARKTFAAESQSIAQLSQCLDDSFVQVVKQIYNTKGRIIVTGIGKSALIAQKIVATFNSTGTPSMFLHAADAIHGDLGMVQQNDLVIILSKSGDTPEFKVMVPYLKRLNIPMIALVCSLKSFLAHSANYVIYLPIEQEACPHNLAPSSSTAVQMAMGDALAFCVLQLRDFSTQDFALLHPGGILGKRLYLTVGDLYVHNHKPQVLPNASIKNLIIEISSKRLGATAVISSDNKLLGIITDGDLRRMLKEYDDLNALSAQDIMSPLPKTVSPGTLAIDAFELMKANSITQVIIEENKQYLGMVHIHDIIREGLI